MKKILFVVVILLLTVSAIAGQARGFKDAAEKPPGLTAGSFLTDYTGGQWVILNRKLEGEREDGVMVYSIKINFVQNIGKK